LEKELTIRLMGGVKTNNFKGIYLLKAAVRINTKKGV